MYKKDILIYEQIHDNFFFSAIPARSFLTQNIL